MKQYPKFDPDLLLEEIREWSSVILSGKEALTAAKVPGLDTRNEIANSPQYEEIRAYLRASVEAQSGMNMALYMMKADSGREALKNGSAFVPLFLEHILLGYSLAMRELLGQDAGSKSV